jgi:hypothetical protein
MPAVPMTASTAVHAMLQTTAGVLTPFPTPFNVSGTFAHPIGPIGNPDSGPKYTFKGTGKTKTLGVFTLKGTIQLPGFIAVARATGTLIITTAKGTITLSLLGPKQAPGSLPKSFSYSIVKGTGSYVHSKGKGTILASASGITHKFLFRFTPTV